MFRLLLQSVIGLFIIITMIFGASYFVVSLKGASGLYHDAEVVPGQTYGVVLGTSRLLRSGADNPFFQNRIHTAAELYKSGKIEKILLSGDFSPPYYNEPGDMKRAIMDLGIPESALLLDPFGYRTYSSVVRAHKVYEMDSFLIISQAFHAKRAVFIARENNINARAVVAPDPALRVRWLKSPYFREIFARARSIWDCYFVEPHVITEMDIS